MTTMMMMMMMMRMMMMMLLDDGDDDDDRYGNLNQATLVLNIPNFGPIAPMKI